MSERSTHSRTPSCRLHKPSGQAIVTFDGRTFYLGRYGTQTSKHRYDQLIAEWLINGRNLPPSQLEDGITVGELVLRYWQFARDYYVKNGRRTSKLSYIRLAVRPLNELYADKSAAEFGPLALKAVRQQMVERGLCRNVINGCANRIKRMFRWAAENELVPGEVYQAVGPENAVWLII